MKTMLIAKCKECGYVEQVPDSWAGKELECSCGNIVHVPSRFKLKEPAPVTSPTPRQIYKQKVPVKLPKKQSTAIYVWAVNSDESPRFGRLQFFLHTVASAAVCFVSFLIFGLAFPHLIFPHLISMIGCSVWQIVVTLKRLDDCGFNNMHAVVHAVPLAIISTISLITILNPTMSLNSPALAGINLGFSLWCLGVFVVCLFQPGKTKVEKEA